MKLCLPHWADLKAAIEERGLTPLVSKNGQEAMSRAVSELENPETPSVRDPLMSATLAIYSNALRAGGIYLMMGELCPLCEMEKHTSMKAADWIKYAADDERAHFDRLKKN